MLFFSCSFYNNIIYTCCVMKTFPHKSRNPLFRAWIQFSTVILVVSTMATPAYADGLSVFIDPVSYTHLTLPTICSV